MASDRADPFPVMEHMTDALIAREIGRKVGEKADIMVARLAG